MIKQLIISLCLLPLITLGQNKLDKFTFGLQFKPIISAAYFNAGDETAKWDDYTFEISPRFGQSLGMIVRYNFSSTFSAETGMNLINRRYRQSIKNAPLDIDDFSKFTLRSYELPMQILSYVRISKDYYLNAAFGNSFNVFASDIISFGQKNAFYYQSTSRRKRTQSAFIANLGLEYRHPTKGIFYFGASFHRPWKNTARSFPEYDDGNITFNTEAPGAKDAKYLDISGNYFTIDLRYFFLSKK
jgi:hypothetical protein